MATIFVRMDRDSQRMAIMAQQFWQSPSATTYDTLPGGVEKTYSPPANTIVQPNQDFSFEFLFPEVTAAHVGTTANIYRTLSSDATAVTNLESIGTIVIEAGDVGGPVAFIRDVYGLVARNIVVKITPAASIRFRLSVVGATVNG